MKGNQADSNWSLVIGLVVLACASRCISPLLLSQPSNFAPLTAIALFSGARLKDTRSAIAIPFLAVFVSDALVNGALYGNYSPFYEGFYWQYSAYLTVSLLGRYCRSVESMAPILGLGLGSSVIFFVISNIGVWLGSGLYDQTLNGLALCFTMALPFLKGSIASDLAFSLVLFGAYSFLVKAVKTNRSGACLATS